MAKVFQKGDFRSGYYRDQTFMFAIGELTLQQFFAQLYAHADLAHEPSSGGRLMNVHFASRILDEEGKFKKLTDLKSTTAASTHCPVELITVECKDSYPLERGVLIQSLNRSGFGL